MDTMSVYLWTGLPAGLGFLCGHCLVPSGGTQVSLPAMGTPLLLSPSPPLATKGSLSIAVCCNPGRMYIFSPYRLDLNQTSSFESLYQSHHHRRALPVDLRASENTASFRVVTSASHAPCTRGTGSPTERGLRPCHHTSLIPWPLVLSPIPAQMPLSLITPPISGAFLVLSYLLVLPEATAVYHICLMPLNFQRNGLGSQSHLS